VKVNNGKRKMWYDKIAGDRMTNEAAGECNTEKSRLESSTERKEGIDFVANNGVIMKATEGVDLGAL
jgi:hypothetical protein